jgi:ATP-binding cassette subfamily B protein/subfamily B ATP-binding cassette protein MsbA
MIGDTITIAGTVVVMVAMDARLALLTFCVIPLMILATHLFSRKARTAFLNTRETIGEVVGELAEDIGGVREIQAFSQEDHTHRRFDASNRENRDANVSAMTLSFVFMPAVDLLSIVATGIVLLAGGLMVVRGNLTIGVMVAFMTYVSRFFLPIRDLSQLYTTLQSASAGGTRVLELLDTPPAIVDDPNAVEIPTIAGRSRIRGKVTFDHVSFSYNPDTEVLHDICFEVEPGSTVALVGPTGAGKTSIVSLLCRFYEPQAGGVLIDGIDLRRIATKSLHAHMGYVPQFPFVFSGTIRDNIRFGRPDASEESVRHAAEAAEADNFIERLPEAYDTVIAEGGANLSTGQRQLICIARAVLVDPSIIILDEATSSVDTVTEGLIQRALAKLLLHRTSVVVAHRLSTVRNADRIFVVDGGRITEEGSHEDLAAGDGLYRTLYERQFIKSDELDI